MEYPYGKLCICLDPKDLEKVIIRENHKSLIFKEIMHNLTGSTTYSKLDIKKGFWYMHPDQ